MFSDKLLIGTGIESIFLEMICNQTIRLRKSASVFPTNTEVQVKDLQLFNSKFFVSDFPFENGAK